MLPFSREVYFYLFGQFNSEYLWLQVLGGIGTAVIVLACFGRLRVPARALLGGLALIWAASAWFWFFQTFAPINFLAPLYGYLAIAQALALGLWARLCPKAQLGARARLPAISLFLIAFSFPLVDLIYGPGWPNSRWPALNVEPLLCVTVGLVLQMSLPQRYWLALVPLLLAVVTTYTAWVLPLRFDWVVLPAILLAGILSKGMRVSADGHR